MKILDQQLHGYRNGHQLLSTTLKLPKADQELIDRLSDIAGPLRPNEQFEPYLTCYSLPSGSHYVLGRTWQDFDAPRAGCVRTRSLVIPMSDWMTGVDIGGLLAALSNRGSSGIAEPVKMYPGQSPLPHVAISQTVELIEALFLEDRKPIVVFDAVDSEAITIRLLAAFWPSFRRSFAASTFALSPRSLGTRTFDLVFAPKDAKSRFSDWPGRRIDARKLNAPRHRWSNEIADRVFGGDIPSLLREDSLGELTSEDGGTEAKLRISLLWNELHEKLQASPNAVLGLLDIANSRSVRNIEAIRRIEPELGLAARRAITTLPPSEAWRFLLALTDKLRDVRLRLSVAKSIRAAAIELANRAPFDAITNVKMLSTAHGQDLLLGAVGDGLAQGFNTERAVAVLELEPTNFVQLLLLSPSLAEASLTHYPIFSARLATALSNASPDTRSEAKRRLLRLLVDDWQVDAARVLIAELNRDELLVEAKLLDAANGLAAGSFHAPLVEQARMIGAVIQLRDVVAEFPGSRGSDALLLRLIGLVPNDLQWLLENSKFTDERRLDLLRRLLRTASEAQFKSMIVGQQRDSALDILMRNPADNIDIIDRLLDDEGIEPSTAIDTAVRLLPYVDDYRARQLASRALGILLPRKMGVGRKATLEKLLKTMGSSLNGSWAFRMGLQREVSGEIVAENLIAFNRSPPAIRQRFLMAIEDLALTIVARERVDYSESSVVEAASLIWDAAINDKQALLRSSTILLPFLLRLRQEPVSPLIAATFPSVYQALKDSKQGPDFFGLFLFVEWDKRKIVRRELVDAFLHSNWQATDVALAAARAGDPERILRLIAKNDDGARVITDIRRNLSLIPKPWRIQVAQALNALEGDSALLNESDY